MQYIFNQINIPGLRIIQILKQGKPLQKPKLPMSNQQPDPQNNQQENPLQTASSEQIPQLALRCGEFFHSLSKYCLAYYENHKRQEKNKKSKIIKKAALQSRKPKFLKDRFNDQNNEGNELEITRCLPKKPLTAYIIYFQEKKPSFVQRYKSLNLSELTKLIAKEWKQIPVSHKQPFLDKASDDRKRYDTEMNQYRKRFGVNFSYRNDNNAEVVMVDESNAENEKIPSDEDEDRQKSEQAIEIDQ